MPEVIYINEWYPDPPGKDDPAEFVELYNSGEARVSLNGYSLGASAKKIFSLSGYSVPAGGYLILKKSQTRLSLKNTDGVLSLYGPDGSLVDRGAFTGAAQTGRSFARAVYGYFSDDRPQMFSWSTPTPGNKNPALHTAVAMQNYPVGVPLNLHSTALGFIEAAVGTAGLITGILVYVVQKNLQDIFFRGNDRARRITGAEIL